MFRLAIITTHPIQYNAPLFALLAKRGNIAIKVFYTWGEAVLEKKFDPGFNKNIDWDIPLLEGYEYAFVENRSAEPGSHHFKGIDNPGLIAAIEGWKATAVLVYGWSFKSHLKAMRHFHKKVPVLFRGDSTLLDKTGFVKKSLRYMMLKWVYRFVDIALFTGQSNREYFLEYGLKDDQLVFAGHAVDNKRFSNDAGKLGEVETWRHKLGIAKEDIVFLYAGKLLPKKDPGRLLDAFTKAGLPDAHLVMVGNGKTEVVLKEKYGQGKHIHFIDFQNQSRMPVLYQLCDVFVLPSIGPGETWGLAVNEAMAAGKAVLVSDRCGCAADLVQEGANGSSFPAGKEAALKEKLEWFSDNREKLIDMGQASLTIIQAFSFEEMAETIETILLKSKTS